MISPEIFSFLCSAEAREAIEQTLARRPSDIALDRKVPQAASIATQVKYLQRAKVKLPSYYAARCIIPPRAFEQSSSEATAGVKRLSGGSVLELTGGLGVDTLYLSQIFERSVSLERDELLADVTRENLRRLGAEGVEILATPAEEYLERCQEHFDWIYVDPDRRGASGEKLVRLEDCSPNIIELMPHIRRLCRRLAIKLSPIFDVDEGRRLFPDSHIEVVSLGGECKEVLIYTGAESPSLSAVAVGRGECRYPISEIDNTPCLEPFVAERYGWLVIPDVALQKSRLACHALRGVADIFSNNGFGFAESEPVGVIGRYEAIDKVVSYEPKVLIKELRGEGVEILKRDFPLETRQILSQLKIREGGRRRIAFTKIGDRLLAIFLK
ncbi:MAG: SAM-dependent methyltransferase [Rikenellaceae bacterium]